MAFCKRINFSIWIKVYLLELERIRKFAVFLEDCVDIFFVNIMDPIIGHHNKLRKLFSDNFLKLDSHTVCCTVNQNKIVDVSEEYKALAKAALKIPSNALNL